MQWGTGEAGDGWEELGYMWKLEFQVTTTPLILAPVESLREPFGPPVLCYIHIIHKCEKLLEINLKSSCLERCTYIEVVWKWCVRDGASRLERKKWRERGDDLMCEG